MQYELFHHGSNNINKASNSKTYWGLKKTKFFYLIKNHRWRELKTCISNRHIYWYQCKTFGLTPPPPPSKLLYLGITGWFIIVPAPTVTLVFSIKIPKLQPLETERWLYHFLIDYWLDKTFVKTCHIPGN